MKKKLVIYLLSTVIFIFVVVTALFVSIFNYEYQQNLKDKLQINNNMIISLLQSNNLRNHEKFFMENLSKSEIRVTYIDKKGKVIYDSNANGEVMDNHNNRQELFLRIFTSQKLCSFRDALRRRNHINASFVARRQRSCRISPRRAASGSRRSSATVLHLVH